MPNSYFQFKQFTVQQDQCAMKVCTDACILGAWFAQKIPSYSMVLDIGSGTGLLMLMLAQKNKSKISGIEIDLASCRQSKENIARCRWHERMNVFPGDVRSYSFAEKFDFMITNPPFFEGDLLSPDKEKNMAKHSTSLTLEELIQCADQYVDASGSFGILLPFHRTEYFEEMGRKNNFYLKEKLSVKQTPRHDFFRSILHFSRSRQTNPDSFQLCIQDAYENFTPEFTELMKDYYLQL
jgi:tRNA1Val (adenine37-N6)-methyltransferase